jgi:hypothetical protein
LTTAWIMLEWCYRCRIRLAAKCMRQRIVTVRDVLDRAYISYTSRVFFAAAVESIRPSETQRGSEMRLA